MFRESKTIKDNYTSSNGNLHFNSNNSLNINTSNNNNNNSHNNTTSTTSTTKHNTTKTHQLFHKYNFKQIHLSNSINRFKPNDNETKTKITKLTSSKSPTNQKMTKSNTIVYKTLTNAKTNINLPQKTIVPFNTITDLKLSYNKQMMEKDLKIEKLQKELKFYKSQYMKLQRSHHNNSNKQFSPIKTPLLNKSIPRKRSNNKNFYMHTTIQQQPMKNSFEFNGNQSYIKKQHERELSERINNFYTPKANELIRNFNVKKHRSSLKHNNVQNSISSLSKNKKVNSYSKKSLMNNTTSNNHRNGKKEFLAMTIPSEYLSQMIGIAGNNKNSCGNHKTPKNGPVTTTTSNINYVDSLNGIIQRMNGIVNTLFSLKEK